MTSRYANELSRQNHRDLSQPLLHETAALTDQLAAKDPSSSALCIFKMNSRVLLAPVSSDLGDTQTALRYDVVAGYGKAFGMNVLVWSSEGSLQRARQDGYATALSQQEFFERCDVVSLHLRLVPATRGIVKSSDLLV